MHPTLARSEPSARMTLDRSLLAYALAGGAIAAVATTAEAAIVTSGHVKLKVGSLGSPAANGGNWSALVGIGAAGVKIGWEYDSALNHSRLGIKATAPKGLEFAKSTGEKARRFHFGEKMTKTGFSGGGVGTKAFLAAYDATNAPLVGVGYQWPIGGTGFVGFRFLDASSNYLRGWIEISVSPTANLGEQATLVRWAYQDNPNGVIRAGMSSIPLPGAAALAAFAAGAVGLNGWRRGRQRAG